MKNRIPFLAGKKVLISAGPMRTNVDPVRHIQNKSSGKMGLEIALAAREAGASVQVLLGPVSDEMKKQYSDFPVTSYEGPGDYWSALEKLFPECDIFFSAAAVLDFEVLPVEKKIERQELEKMSELKMPIRAVPDIVAHFSKARAPHQIVIAFAAETGTESEIIQRAEKKMRKKATDAIVANPVWPGLGPDSDQNLLWVLRDGKDPVTLGPAPKSLLAKPLLETLFS